MTASSFVLNPTGALSLESTEQSALDAAFDRCASGLYRYFVVRLGDSHLADDMMQLAWLAAHQGRGRVPPTELEYWLRGVARNLVRGHWLRQSRRPDHVPIPDAGLATALSRRLVEEEIPDDVMARREARDQLMLALTSLDADMQTLVIARYFQNLSNAALAERFGVSERAIEGRLYRARQALRMRLERLDDEGQGER